MTDSNRLATFLPMCRRAVAWFRSIAFTFLRLVGLKGAQRRDDSAPQEILILGGYGYGNTGDEAQLGANLTRWRKLRPRVECLVLSPHPIYTAAHHGCRSALASRVVLFRANEVSDYGRSSSWFRFAFWPTLFRMEINAQLMRAGLAPWLASSAETRLLSRLQDATVVHVSGGGFMTGPTRSRLWDTCLVLRLCQRLGTPYFLTGQTLGIFENRADRWLARSALRKAVAISLRDPADSQHELMTLGITPERLLSSVDDAVFCDKAVPTLVSFALAESGLERSQTYMAINYHWWGMDCATRERSTRRLAAVMDALSEEFGWHVLFVPMVSSDEEAQRSVMAHMKQPSSILIYDYAYPTVRGVIAGAEILVSFKHHPLIFAVGEQTPCVAISFDPYYQRKNTGAMTNFGQGRYCLDRSGFFGPRCINLIKELVAERAKEITSMRTHLQHAQETQDAFFKRVLEDTHLNVTDDCTLRHDRSNKAAN